MSSSFLDFVAVEGASGSENCEKNTVGLRADWIARAADILPGDRHFHLESETAEWLVSLMPSSVPLEDRRAAADMAVTYGELAAADVLTYTAVVWSAIFIYSQFFRRPKKEKGPRSLDSSGV